MKKGFLCYAHEDAHWKNFVLSYVSNSNKGDIWHDSEIKPGERWEVVIDAQLQTASVGIFLISQNFINSQFIQERELPMLLQKAEQKSCRLLFIACESFNDNGFNAIKKFQWLWGPDDRLLKLREDNQDRFQEALRKIGQGIDFALDATLDWRDDRGIAAHIVTGGKGGVGKTLLSVAIFLAYVLGFKRLIHGLDLNSTNADFHRLLGFKPTDDFNPNWQTAESDPSAHISRPNDPYILPEGISGFWEQVISPLQIPAYYQHNITVDTNLHIANLYRGNPDPDDVVKMLVNKTQRTVYLWIVWTYASIIDYQSVNQAIRHYREKYPDRFKIIHVLNPSALMPPTVDIREASRLGEYQQREQTYRKQRSELTDPNEIQFLDLLLSRNSESMRAIAVSLSEKQLISGLQKIWELDTISSNVVNDEKVGELLAKHLIHKDDGTMSPNAISQGFESLCNDIKVTFGGRPITVLPITTYDRTYFGYTEKNRIGGNLSLVRKSLEAVCKEVEQFLRILLKENP